MLKGTGKLSKNKLRIYLHFGLKIVIMESNCPIFGYYKSVLTLLLEGLFGLFAGEDSNYIWKKSSLLTFQLFIKKFLST